MNESLTDEITDYLQKDIIMDFAGYEERTYSERINREDGSYDRPCSLCQKRCTGYRGDLLLYIS